MILTINDWVFDVDLEATRGHTTKNASDHCTCGYCRNFYEAAGATHPETIEFLEVFGIDYHGPSELMPFEPTLMLACYRVYGKILQWGHSLLTAGDVPVNVETSENGTFFLWVGEMVLPWLQEEAAEDVVSPANLPEFLDRMQQVWLQRYGEERIYS